MKELYYQFKENYVLYIWFGLFFIGRSYISYDDYNTNHLSGFFEWISISLILGSIFGLIIGAFVFGILIGIRNGYEFYKDKQYAYLFANFIFTIILTGLIFFIVPGIIHIFI